MSGKCLVVERDASTARMLEALLRRSFPYEIVNVSTIAEGIERMRAEDSFEAAVVDISVSEERLSELTSETRKQKTGVVILTTRRLARPTLELFVSDDVFAILPKPFDVDDLVNTLREAIKFARTGSHMAARLFGFLKDT